MGLSFTPPPDWLMQEYTNRKSPGQTTLDSAQQAAQTYLALKTQKTTLDLAQQAKDIEMAKGLAANGQDFTDAYNQIVAARTPTATAAKVPFSTPPAPTALGGTLNPDPKDNQFSPHIAASLAMGHTPVTGLDYTPYTQPLPSQPSTPQAPMTTNIATDPLVQEYQKDPLAFKKQHGAAGITKLKTQAEIDKLMTEKTDTALNQTYIGNSEDGDPVNQDKHGKFFVNGKPYTGKIYTKNSETPTAATRGSAEFADTLMPHIKSMRDLISKADKAGYIGPMAGRVYGKFLAGQVGTTGNPDADKLLGQLSATNSLLKTAAMRVHFGSRGGSQMYDHFSEMLDSGKQSAAMLNGSLDSIQSFMQGYSDAGHPGRSGGSPIPTISNDADFSKLPSGSQFKDPSGQTHRKK